MNKSVFSCFLLFAISCFGVFRNPHELPKESVGHAITYEFSGGRFGDNLLSYLHAKWLSYRYGIPLLYKPFTYSSDLFLHDKEVRYENSQNRLRYRNDVKNIESDCHSSLSFLFVCPYFPEDPVERVKDGYYYFDVDWKEPGFRKLALEMLAPKKTLWLVDPPKDTVNLAIHVRDGENYDANDMRIRFPLKLPPFSFYLEALPQVLERFRGKAIYCHIFTDVELPQRLVETFKEIVPQGISVRFGYRRGPNRQNRNVLDDFFSFFQFDALIRPHSHFSVIPSCLHDFAILCYPSAYRIEEERPIIEKIEIEIQEELYQRLLREKQSI